MEKLKRYWRALTKQQREDLAASCGTTFGHLRNVAYGCKPCGAELAVALERESNGEVRCDELCPNVDWDYLRARTSEHLSA